jgi:flagellar basal-body rod protein FlgB
VSDVTSVTLHAAMRGLAARQRVIADNVANLETPGFRARRVDFEGSLRRARGAGQPAAAEVTTRRSAEATGLNGNNVNLDDETVALVDTTLRYQLVTEAMSAKFRLLRSALAAR